MRKLKKIPAFQNESEEFEFWSIHDITDYVDTSKPLNIKYVNLKPSTKNVTIRLPESMLYSLKILANKKDVPYQSLLKVFLAEKIREEIMPKKRA